LGGFFLTFDAAAELGLEGMSEARIDRWEEGSAPLDKIAQAFAL
jgi:hypothetical protein